MKSAKARSLLICANWSLFSGFTWIRKLAEMIFQQIEIIQRHINLFQTILNGYSMLND